jgi:psp operon transcriptional activator
MRRSPDSARAQEGLGQSAAFLAFNEALSKAAKVDRPVLVIGERGTGKELGARRLHYLSERWDGPYVTLNCSALSPTLIEAELFGHEAGAFTGAVKARPGRFERADGGTLFLDELGNIPRPVQEKILRVVEYGSFERVGATREIEVDVRILGATHADLPAMAARGEFMRDLLDRLSFEVLHLPPLRERGEDILLLARHFAARIAMELGLADPPEILPEAAAALAAYPWPGNIRELKNVVERAVYHSDGAPIPGFVFDPFRPRAHPETMPVVRQQAPAPGPGEEAESARPGAAARPGSLPAASVLRRPLKEQVRELEVAALGAALTACQHNQKRAAAALGLTYHQFRGLYRKHREALEKQSGPQT